MTNHETAPRFRRRAEIEAVQWTGSNADAMSVFCSPFDFQTIDPEDRVEDPDRTAAVRTHPHGGWVGLKPGDWVVREAGRYATASDEEFRAAWEPASAAVSVPPPAPRADALAAVRALHQPMQRGPFTICAHCSGWDGKWRCLGVVTDYPCPTIRALDGEPQPVGPCVAGEEQQNETRDADGCWCGHPEDRHWAGSTRMTFPDGCHDCRGWNGAHGYGQELPWLPEGDEPAAGARQDGAQPCAECSHPKDAHREGDDPVTPGTCGVCDADNPDEAHHDFAQATP